MGCGCGSKKPAKSYRKKNNNNAEKPSASKKLKAKRRARTAKLGGLVRASKAKRKTRGK